MLLPRYSDSSIVSSATPMAPITSWQAGMVTSSPRASSKARFMPTLAATPPWKTTGGSSFLPLARLFR